MRQRFVVEIVDDVDSQETMQTPEESLTPPQPADHQLSGRGVQVETTSGPPQPSSFVSSDTPVQPSSAPEPSQSDPHFSRGRPSLAREASAPASPSPEIVSSTPDPTVKSEKTIVRQSRPSRPIDFDAHEERIRHLFQEQQLADVREQPNIAPPPLTKSQKRVQHERTAQEQAFLESLTKPNHQPDKKIEDFYRQHNPRSEQESHPKATPSWLKPITGVFSWLLAPPEISTTSLPKKASPKEAKERKPFRVPKWAIAMLILVGAVSATLASGYWYVRSDIASTQEQVQLLAEDLREGNMLSARERVEALEQKQDRYQAIYATVRPAVPYVLGDQKTTHIDKLLTLTDSGLQIIDTGLDTYDHLELGYQQFMGNESGDTIETLMAVSGQLEALFTQMSSIQAELQTLDNPFEMALITDVQDTVSENFPMMRRAVLAVQQLSYALPELLGEDQKRQYLVLLQNNEELRPTGGFIGSFAILTVEKGRFVDFRVEDVYEADGQLKGYVTPPEEIVEYLGEAQWFLRDVNWSPDFPTVAEQAGWFLDKEINIDPDGVIGINLHVAQKLLAVTGPISLPDYDEIITKDNLYERAEMHSEINFFPGSTQKRDFLSAVANQLFDRITRDDSNKLAILRAFYESAEEAQMLVAVEQPEANEAFTNLGWTGALLTPECPGVFSQQDCFVDTVMQVEANVGVNKANQYIRRTIDHSVVVDTNAATHTRTITLQNTATSNAWPEGAYKVYLRLFVPESAQLAAATIDNQKIDDSVIREKSELDKQSIGFLVNVPIRSTKVITFTYSVPIPADQQEVYALFEQKQSGTSDDPIVHEIEIPAGREVLTVAPEPEIEGRTLRFSTDRTKHQFMAVEKR